MVASRYFRKEEFKNATSSCSLQDMKQDFMLMLDKTREMANIPFQITSAYRTIEHEKKQGRSGNSAHTEGCAVDIKAIDGRTKWLIINSAIKCGFNRIGFAKGFIHLDSSKKLDQNVIWEY
ncbi:MAG: hypothetical protein LBI45_09530 [Bacteroidales bacterium]|jgi:uncharacterized protein YcbK (DUF882 family)|nr:hypothetical protein [Bacteroidales bacterium]